MKVYFTASIVGKKKLRTHYEAIVAQLQKHASEVQADHILSTSEEDIRLESPGERRAFHAKLEKWINGCDCFVAEVSYPSISVGYEISMALHWGKPILILFQEGDPPSLLSQYKEEKIVCEHYDLDSLPNLIASFLKYAGHHADTRFTFFLPTHQALYLEQAAKKSGLSKASFLRTLIEQHSHHDNASV